MSFTGGLTNPRPWRGRCRAGYSNTGGPPLPQKRAPLQKRQIKSVIESDFQFFFIRNGKKFTFWSKFSNFDQKGQFLTHPFYHLRTKN